MGKALFLAAVLAIGCGETSESPLVGNWLFTGDARAAAVDFGPDGQYATAVMQLTGTSSANVQVEKGAYADMGTSVTFTPQQATCPGSHPAYATNYAITGSSLVLSDASTLLALTRNTAAGGSVVATNGCFADDGTFTASPLAPVR